MASGLLLDENLSPRLVSPLATEFRGSVELALRARMGT